MRAPGFDPIKACGPRLCVDAGAGSGKTTVLIARILHLLENKMADLDEIVAITFTDAAAAEMRMRLRREFRKKAPVDNPAEMTRWRQLERRADSARLSTIHSFCSALVRENALRAGFDPEFSVLAEAESVLLCRDVIEETLHTLLEREAGQPDREGPATRAAAEIGFARLARELYAMLNRRRLMGLIKEGGFPHEPEALARHWRQLVEEAQQRRFLTLRHSRRLASFRNLLESLAGACSNADDAREAGRRRLIEAFDRIQRAGNAKDIEKEIRGILEINYRRTSRKNWGETVLERLKGVQKEIKQFAENQLPPESAPEIDAKAAALAADIDRIYENLDDAYKRGKIERASADFDDLIQAAYEMLRDNDEIRARTARGIKFLLIDEFQDTDSWQLQIARLLADHPEGPDLFIVGDAKQSIYDFRGAEVEVFQAEKCSAQVTFLDKNYRTLPDVLSFINETFQRSGLLEAVEPDYAPLTPHRPALGEPRVEFLLPPSRDDKPGVDAYRSGEAEMIAARLDEMVRGPRPVTVFDRDGQVRPAGFGDAAILFRAMSSVYLYEAALRRRNIPYRVIAGRGYYERREIVDLRNLLAVLVDPCDEMALLGFLRGPLGGLSDEALVMLSGGRGLLHAFSSAEVPPQFRENSALEHARALVARLRERACTPLPAFLRYLLDETGFEAIELSQFLGAQKAHNMRKAIDLANDFARTQPATLASFLRYLDQAALDDIREGEAPMQPESAGAVTIMSIHKSKGLEFPIVVAADLSREPKNQDRGAVLLHRRLGMGVRVADSGGDTATPAICRAIKNEQAEKDEAEQARMLYVAMTRARDWLLLSGSPEAGKRSWMQTFDKLYSVCGADDGAVVQGASGGWSAVVRRTRPSETTRSSMAPRARQGGAHEAMSKELAQRAGPVDAIAAAQKTFSVSEILNAIFNTPDEQEPWDAEQFEPDAAARERMFRGTLVHRMFERWDFSSDPPIDAVLADECPDPVRRSVFESALRDIAAKFKKSQLAPRFASCPIQREVPFYLDLGGTLVHGVIDAVLEGGAVVLDYKTGHPGGTMADRYEFQLRLYAAAVERLLDRTPRQGILYYADHGEVHEVDVSPEAVVGVLHRAAAAILELCNKRNRGGLL
ncbi:MAG TPA: UvrD-helicase domain-containing protein [Candidatus Bathyarchaeia archaeon]|nr:UvrD-helicase domain-containing protein [Candidatus Bathyarchaeia archaeon]